MVEVLALEDRAPSTFPVTPFFRMPLISVEGFESKIARPFSKGTASTATRRALAAAVELRALLAIAGS